MGIYKIGTSKIATSKDTKEAKKIKQFWWFRNI